MELKQGDELLGLRRQPSAFVTQRNHGRLERLRALKAEHPCWGYRRLWAYRHFVEQQVVHKNRRWRLLREHHLLVQPNMKLKATRTPTGRQPNPTTPNEWWGSAMTKVFVEGVGWVYLVVVLEWSTKMMVG